MIFFSAVKISFSHFQNVLVELGLPNIHVYNSPSLGFPSLNLALHSLVVKLIFISGHFSHNKRNWKLDSKLTWQSFLLGLCELGPEVIKNLVLPKVYSEGEHLRATLENPNTMLVNSVERVGADRVQQLYIVSLIVLLSGNSNVQHHANCIL